MHAQSCSSLCDPMECSLPGSSIHGTFQARSGLPFPSSGDLLHPEIKSATLVSPSLQVDSLPLSYQGSPINQVWDLGSILGLGRYPREGKGYPLQYSDLENSMYCIVQGSQRVRHDWVTYTHFTNAILFFSGSFVFPSFLSSSLAFFSCELIISCSGLLWFSSLYLLWIYCIVLFCGYIDA